MHTLTEHYLKNEELPVVKPLPDFLFKIASSELNKIDNIHTLEGSLYSKELGVAGTVDCIAEYDGELLLLTSNISENQNQETGSTVTLFSVQRMPVCTMS